MSGTQYVAIAHVHDSTLYLDPVTGTLRVNYSNPVFERSFGDETLSFTLTHRSADPVPAPPPPIEDIREKMYKIYHHLTYISGVESNSIDVNYNDRTFTLFTYWFFPNVLGELLDSIIKIEDFFERKNCECSFFAEENPYFKVRLVIHAELKE